MLSKKWRKEFYDVMSKVLKEQDITQWTDNGLQDVGPSVEGKFNSPFGPIKFSVYDDWVAMRLEYHPGGAARWYHFSHWKVNFHTFAGQRKVSDRMAMSHYGLALNAHLKQFHYLDRPSDVEYQQLKLAADAEAAKWAEMYQNANI